MLDAFSHWNRRGNGSQGSVLVMAGPDEGDGFRQHLESLTSQMGLTQRVLFTGPLYGDAKWAAYRDADVFCFAFTEREFRQHGSGSGRLRNAGSSHRSLRNRPHGGPARGSRRAA